MSEFGLGPRYGSEDMRRDMGLAGRRSGVVFTDAIESVRFESSHPSDETMPEATSHIDDLVGAVEEIRRLCAVADNDRRFVNKAAVVEVLDRWCV